MSGLLRPTELKEISHSAKLAKLQEKQQYIRQKEQQEAALHKAFIEREISSDVIDRINHAVRVAAEQDLTHAQIVSFPCKYCNDGGRRINNFDPDWPQSLEGFAKKAFAYFETDLRPLGFKMHAEIVSFPDGIPGEAALFLKW